MRMFRTEHRTQMNLTTGIHVWDSSIGAEVMPQGTGETRSTSRHDAGNRQAGRQADIQAAG